MTLTTGLEALAVCLLLCACGDSGAMYTLYRGSTTDPTERFHVSSFDSDASATYNEQSCRLAAEHFDKQRGPGVRHWCEAGAYRP